MTGKLAEIWFQEDGQGLTEYAVMLALILAIVIGMAQLVGHRANSVFSTVADDLLHHANHND